MSELENPAATPLSGRGFTWLHELLATLIDQVVELRAITEGWARTQVEFEDRPNGKRHVPRPISAIDAAKKIKVTAHRDEMDDWYEQLMQRLSQN